MRRPGAHTVVGAAILLMGLGVGLPIVAAVLVPATVRIPSAQPHPEGTPQVQALFSHRSHDGLGCYMCHPSLFPQAPWAFRHRDMTEGRACGSCHDGRVAKAVAAFSCGACHVP